MADLPAERLEYGLRRYLLEVEAVFDDPAGLADAATDPVPAAREVQQIGHRHGRVDLVAGGMAGEGRRLVRRGRVAEGLALLDAAMVALLSHPHHTDLTGRVLCQLLAAAYELVDLTRGQDWSRAARRWLAGCAEPGSVPGMCWLRLAQVSLDTGDWAQAAAHAERATGELGQSRPAAAGESCYQLGEVHRLRGDLAAAEDAYRRAHHLGRDPQPGLALLRLARRQPQAALAGVGGALVAETDRLARVRLCAAQVEIALAAGELGAARKASDELADTAATYRSRGLAVLARQASGAVLLSSGQPVEAVPLLHGAAQQWQELTAPYEAARTRLMLAHAYRAMADPDAAAAEHEVATAVLVRLAAAAPTRWLAVPGESGPGGAASHTLTARETEVLVLVAAGRSNRQVATHLSISEKTVARHLANIFAKIGARSRTEAAAYAYRHGLAPSAGWSVPR